MASSSQPTGDNDDMNNKQPQEILTGDDDEQLMKEGDGEQANLKDKRDVKEIEEKARKRKSEVWLEFERHTEEAKDGTIRKYDAANALNQAVNLFLDIGRLNMAARYCKDLGELYEQEQNIEKAMNYLERAADLFQSEEVTTSANQCKQKVAQFAAQLEQYPKAIEILEEIARQSANNNLLKYSVKGILLNAGICQLCRGDVVGITNALERYQDLDPTFSGTRECKLLSNLAEALDEEDVEKFTDCIKEYDSMTRLDPWKTTLLLRAKNTLKAKEDEEDDLT